MAFKIIIYKTSLSNCGLCVAQADIELVDSLDLPRMDRETTVDLMERFRLVERHNGHMAPNRACLLIFGKDPTKWHPRCGIDFVRWEGTERKGGAELNIEKRIRIEVLLRYFPSWPSTPSSHLSVKGSSLWIYSLPSGLNITPTNLQGPCGLFLWVQSLKNTLMKMRNCVFHAVSISGFSLAIPPGRFF